MCDIESILDQPWEWRVGRQDFTYMVFLWSFYLKSSPLLPILRFRWRFPWQPQRKCWQMRPSRQNLSLERMCGWRQMSSWLTMSAVLESSVSSRRNLVKMRRFAPHACGWKPLLEFSQRNKDVLTMHLLFYWSTANAPSKVNTAPLTNGFFRKFIQVWDREKIVLIPDHYIFTEDARANRNVNTLREFAQEQNIKYFYDITDRSNFRVNQESPFLLIW